MFRRGRQLGQAENKKYRYASLEKHIESDNSNNDSLGSELLPKQTTSENEAQPTNENKGTGWGRKASPLGKPAVRRSMWDLPY